MSPGISSVSIMMNQRNRNVNGVSAVDCDAATLQLGEGIFIFIKRLFFLYRLLPVDFNNTHCLMNPEVKVLLETYIQKRIEESGSIPFNQPTAY